MRALPVLALAMDAPPVDLELGRLGRVRGIAVGARDEGVEPPHAGLRPLGVVVRIRGPQLAGPERQPGALQGPVPVQAKADPDQLDRGDQYSGPLSSVVPHPRAVLEVREAN